MLRCSSRARWRCSSEMRPCSSRICPSCFGLSLGRHHVELRPSVPGSPNHRQGPRPPEAAGRTPARARIGRRRRPRPRPGPRARPGSGAVSRSVGRPLVRLVDGRSSWRFGVGSLGSGSGPALRARGPQGGRPAGPGLGRRPASVVGASARQELGRTASAGGSAVSASSPQGSSIGSGSRARERRELVGRVAARTARRPAPGRRSPGDPELGCSRCRYDRRLGSRGHRRRPRSRAAPRAATGSPRPPAAPAPCGRSPGRAALPGPATANPAYGARRT